MACNWKSYAAENDSASKKVSTAAISDLLWKIYYFFYIKNECVLLEVFLYVWTNMQEKYIHQTQHIDEAGHKSSEKARCECI